MLCFYSKVQVIQTSDIFECVKWLNTGKEGVSAWCDEAEVPGHTKQHTERQHTILNH